MLQKFYHSSIGAIKQNEELSQQLNKITFQSQTYQEELEILKITLNNVKNETISKINELEELIENNSIDLSDANETISKLQLKCANLVKEKQELNRKYEVEKENLELINENSQVIIILFLFLFLLFTILFLERN